MNKFALLLILLPASMRADVVDSANNGFTVKSTVTIAAAPGEVYTRIVRDVAQWWDPVHTFSHDSHNLSIDARPMGCFCEKFPEGGGVRHMEVLYAAPAQLLVMGGGIGPLQELGAQGSMTIRLTQIEGGTRVDVMYVVTGYRATGMNSLAAPVDGVVKAQFTRLKAFIEQGSPVPK